jgi:glyoxylase-like metal-dependent hydrolase (beta-lactamase superfamily II)
MHNHIERVAGRVMAVNSYLVHGPDGVVVVDGLLTVSDAGLVHAAIERADAPLAGVLLTHAHPDHYAGLAHIVASDDVPIVATRAVDAVIRRDDPVKDAIVGPMLGAEWPRWRRFPNQLVDAGDTVHLGGLAFRVEELGPGESEVDTAWWLDQHTVFAGDIAYNGMHAYLADGHWEDWLDSLEDLEARLDDDVTLHVGHGPPGTKALLSAQRRYVDAFIEALDANADAVAAGDHTPVLSAMKQLIPGDDLLFLLDLSIDPVAEQRVAREVAGGDS